MLHVTSEIGRLRKVLMHEPGDEVDRMVPSMMKDLLFDDIVFGDRAREEHRRFCRLLQLLGIEVVEALELLVEVLSEEEALDWLWDVLLPELPRELRDRLRHTTPAEVAAALVAGVLEEATHDRVEVAGLFRLTPLPNWCFQRDPQLVMGDSVVFAAMATPARWREGLLARCLFRFHPELRSAPVALDPLQPTSERTHYLSLHRPCLEGGDVLILSPEHLVVGVSERTNSVGVELLTHALARTEGGPRWLEVVHLPHHRAYMHLDTVFTPLDHNAALLFPPVLGATGPQAADTYEVDLHSRDLEPRHRGSLLALLGERWTDGANALALAPGVVVLYDRNVATAEELDRRGFRIVEAEAVLLGQDEVDLEAGERACLLLASHEISRARGGPHCLTHPLVRDDV